jgi:hypothetical protein
MKLLPFDLEKAKNGAKVVTRGGRPARIICTDKKGTRPLVALVVDDDGEISLSYFASGLYSFDKAYSPYDLFLLDETPEPTFGGRTYEIRDDGSLRFSDGENVGAEEVGELVEAWNKAQWPKYAQINAGGECRAWTASSWEAQWPKYAQINAGVVWRYHTNDNFGEYWHSGSKKWVKRSVATPVRTWPHATPIARAEAAKIIGEENL